MDRPREDAIVRSLENLYSLKIINEEGKLTEDIGFRVSEFPVEPSLAVMLINSSKPDFSCSREILILVSMLSVQNVFYSNRESHHVIKAKKKIGAKEGDMITLINIYLRYHASHGKKEKIRFCGEFGLNEAALISAKKIHDQLSSVMKRLKLKIESSEDDLEGILRCIASALFFNIAQKQPDGTYLTVRGKEIVNLHPNSIMNVLYPEWVLFYEQIQTSKLFLRECSEVDYRWLVELARHFYEDTKAKMLKAKYQKEVVQKSRQEEDEKMGIFKKKRKLQTTDLALFNSQSQNPVKKAPNLRTMLSFDENEML